MTAKEYADRERKAEDLEVVAMGGTFSVRSSSGRGGYMITEKDNELICACTDFYMHIHQDPKWKCKHIIAVEKFRTRKGFGTASRDRFDAIDLSGT